MNTAAQLIASFERRGDQVAIVDARGRIATYQDLLAEIARGRSRIAVAMLAPRSKVIVQAPKGMAFASATIALAAEGHAVVGIEMAQGDAVYNDRARFVRADAIITTNRVRAVQRTPLVRDGLGRLGIDVPPRLDLPEIDWDADAVPSSPACVDVDDEALAFVVFTGGTTSAPKGVQLSHRAVRSYLAGIDDLPEWRQITSLVADHPQQVLYGLAHGKTVHLSPARSATRAAHTAKLLFEEGIDCYFGSPSLWHQILLTRVHRSATTWPTAVFLGGAPVTRAMLERLELELDASVTVRCLYGMSEAGLVAHISGRDKLDLLRDSETVGDPVGQLATGVSVGVAPDGELLVSSASRFSGYIGESGAEFGTAFATGDVGRVNSYGLTLLGRKKNMVVQNGVNLYPEQFEARLLESRDGPRAAFDEVALIASPANELGDEHFVLFYTSASTEPSRAVQLAAQVLPRGHEPQRAFRLDSLPRSGRQAKIDRRALAQRLVPRHLQVIQSQLFDQLFAILRDRSPERRRARALHALARRNLARAEQLARSSVAAQLDAPVFILGHQRSGTTLLHRALASSPQAIAMTLPDMLAPHTAGWKMARPLRSVARTVHRVSKRSTRIAGLFDRHDLDPDAPEEEEWLFAALGLSGFVPSAFASTLADAGFGWLRDRSEWDAASRHELINLYAAVVAAWHEHRNDEVPLRHVAKNPAFGPLAGDLLSAFPSARFVVAVREPAAAISSRLGLFAAIHGHQLSSQQQAVVVEDSCRQLNALANQVRRLPADRVHVVSFPDLMDDPRTVIAAAADFADLEAPEGLPPLRPVASNTVAASELFADRLSAAELADALPEFMQFFAQAKVT